MITIAVFFGGPSVEHEVSVITAMQVIQIIQKLEGYRALPVYIGKDGHWYTGETMNDIEQYKDIPTLLSTADQVVLTKSTYQGRGLLRFVDGNARRYRKNISKDPFFYIVDIAFPVLHGTGGEDGSIQGLFEWIDLPYIGCDPLSAAISMDKVSTKQVLASVDIPTVEGLWFYSHDWIANTTQHIEKIEQSLSYPLIIKPSNVGSSVGVSSVASREELIQAVDLATKFSHKVMVERKIINLKEINISVLGNHEIQLTSHCESPITHQEFLTYEDKYMNASQAKGMSASKRELLNLPNDMAEQIKQYATTAFKTLGCSGVTRIDFLYDTVKKQLYLCELNTIPGSLAFYLWEASDISFKKEIELLIEIAHRNYRRKKQILTANPINLLAQNHLLGVKK